LCAGKPDSGIVITDTAAPTLTDNQCAFARGCIGSASPTPSGYAGRRAVGAE
jgi:hypothetical protein